LDRKTVRGFARAAVSYGQAMYRHQESLELVKQQKSTLANLRRWEKKPETRKVSGALESVRQEILVTQQRLRADSRYSKSLSREAARLKRVLETRTRELVTME